jgi:hypothetical protein
MKKKESFKELLERLDEQAAQFNTHLAEANRYFNLAAKKMETLLRREEKEIHGTIRKIRQAIKVFKRDDPDKGGKRADTK